MVADWVKDLVAGVGGPNRIEKGVRATHRDGHEVEVVDGQYWGTHGLSNFWCWKRVLPDGSLSPETEHGYGNELEVAEVPSVPGT